jgi:hypothetical protein
MTVSRRSRLVVLCLAAVALAAAVSAAPKPARPDLRVFGTYLWPYECEKGGGGSTAVLDDPKGRITVTVTCVALQPHCRYLVSVSQDPYYPYIREAIPLGVATADGQGRLQARFTSSWSGPDPTGVWVHEESGTQDLVGHYSSLD